MSKPRTEAGQALAARAKRESWSNWEGLAQFTIPAIEREAATPSVAPPALNVPDGLLPVRPRGKHEIEAAGGWVVACGNYGEYGCMPTEVRDYIVAVLNARLTAEEPENTRA